MTPIRSRFVRPRVLAALACALLPAAARAGEAPAPPAAKPAPVMQALEAELARSLEGLKGKGEHPLYFLAYSAWETRETDLAASFGVPVERPTTKLPSRHFSIALRVGNRQLDNTHPLRGGGGWGGRGGGGGAFPLEDDVDAMRAALWLATDGAFKNAQEQYAKVLTDRKVMVEEEDRSDDFSEEPPCACLQEPGKPGLDAEAWMARLKALSALFKAYPFVLGSRITLSGGVRTRWFVNSEGARLQTSREDYRIGIDAGAKAEDGMVLYLTWSEHSPTVAGLPDDARIRAEIERIAADLDRLRKAPLVEPYVGPAILVHRAAAVFLHEIFGHRVEGHRQKSVSEGQTFTKKVGAAILPDFLSVYDDPTASEYRGIPLMGHYGFDDEGVPAQRAAVVENGILRGFLMSRSPVKGFPKSNGHGRCAPGNLPVARMANTILESSKRLPFDRLREMLVEEAKKQGKPYGLVFHDITGGFTATGRGGPQSFKVLPLLVTRVYVDGRPEEVVRGVDICGTPIMSLEQILATGDDVGAFHGFCGAESGSVPVSCLSPSLLVGKIEIEKKRKSQDRPPILPPPLHDPQPAKEKGK